MTRKGFRSAMCEARPLRARLGMALGGLCVIAACVLARYYWGSTPATAEVTSQQSGRSSPAAGTAGPDTAPESGGPASLVPVRKPVPEIVAMVNGLPITREELARECRARSTARKSWRRWSTST